MQLSKIAAVSGRPGLFTILKPTYNGVIVESLDEAKGRTLAGSSARLSMLSDISMYTTDADGSVSLGTILDTIYEKHKGQPLELTSRSDGADLEEFFATILPNWDQERVYLSDIKKLVTWYNLLLKHAPQAFAKKEEAAAEAPTVEAAPEPAPELAETPLAKKAAKPKESKAEEAAQSVEVASAEKAKPKKSSPKASANAAKDETAGA